MCFEGFVFLHISLAILLNDAILMSGQNVAAEHVTSVVHFVSALMRVSPVHPGWWWT